MRIEIEIPKEFERHFKRDRFSDSLKRIMTDMRSNYLLLSGNYEYETIEMLEKVFKSAKITHYTDYTITLPVKPGDIVYIISIARRFHNEIIPLKVHGIDIRKDDFTVLAKNEKYIGYSISNLYGKKESVDWFLTQAEAERKLKEMENY